MVSGAKWTDQAFKVDRLANREAITCRHGGSYSRQYFWPPNRSPLDVINYDVRVHAAHHGQPMRRVAVVKAIGSVPGFASALAVLPLILPESASTQRRFLLRFAARGRGRVAPPKSVPSSQSTQVR